MHFPILTIILLVPLLGIGLILFTPAWKSRVIRSVAIGTSFFTLILALGLFGFFDRSMAQFQFEERVPWVPMLGISYHVAVDGISLVMVLLSTTVGFAAVLMSSEIQTRQKEFYALLLLMLDAVLGAFVSLDLFFLYFFHELALIPTFLMIGIWGNSVKEDKNFATMQLTIYLSVGALIALIGLVALYFQGTPHTFDLLDLQKAKIEGSTQLMIFPILLLGFGILVSLWPFHTWAPIGYGSAPTPTAMMHAGVLKKFGLYAIIRIGLPLLTEGAEQWAHILMLLCLFNIIYCGLVTLAQRDWNYMIGYSSVMHMGYAFLGISSLTLVGLTGAVLLMFAHGVAVALAFALVGYISSQTGTRDLDKLGGLAKKMPFVATAFTMVALAICGVPGFANFASEILIFFGSWEKYPQATILAVWGVVLSAVYMLRATRDVFFGPLNPRWSALRHAVEPKQKAPFVFLIIILLVVGCWPRLLTDIIAPSVAPIAQKFDGRAHESMIAQRP